MDTQALLKKAPPEIKDRWTPSRIQEFLQKYPPDSIDFVVKNGEYPLPPEVYHHIHNDLLWQVLPNVPTSAFLIEDETSLVLKNEPRSIITAYITASRGIHTLTIRAENSHIHLLVFIPEEASNQLTLNILAQGTSESIMDIYVISHASGNIVLNILATGGWWQRIFINPVLAREKASFDLNALIVAVSGSWIDFQTEFVHKSGKTFSNQLVKSITGENGRGSFSGKIFIDRNCPDVNSYQLNKNLLVGNKKCIFYSRPFLEIYTDEVKCTHGSATSSFNRDHLFYLLSRGISLDTARKLLIQAFMEDVIQAFPAHLHQVIQSSIMNILEMK